MLSAAVEKYVCPNNVKCLTVYVETTYDLFQYTFHLLAAANNHHLCNEDLAVVVPTTLGTALPATSVYGSIVVRGHLVARYSFL